MGRDSGRSFAAGPGLIKATEGVGYLCDGCLSTNQGGLLMRVLIFEPQYVGHNLAYVHHLAERLLKIGCNVHLVTSSQAVRSEEFASHLGDLMDSIHISPLDTFSTRGGGQSIRVNGPSGLYGLVRSLEVGLRMIHPDHVFVPFGNPLAFLGSFPNRVGSWLKRHRVETDLVLLSGKYAYPQHGWLAKTRELFALSILERGPWARIHHIVPHAAQAMKSFSPRLAAKTSLLPDPVEMPPNMNKAQARAMLGIPQLGRVLSLAGLIEARKGVKELLAAFESVVPRLRGNDRLLLAGKATSEIRELMRSRYSALEAQGRIIFVNRHLSNEELWAACIGADVVCTPYPQHRFSASIVIRAARVGVPVLANAIGWMEQTVQRFGLGTTCDTLNPSVFAENILTCLDASSSFRLSPCGKRFIAFHTPENFATRLTCRVAQRIGCSDPYRQVCWDDELVDPQPMLVSA